MDTHNRDPVDHSRTSRQHAGETFIYGPHAPGLAGAAAAIVALVIGLCAFGTQHMAAGSSAIIVAALLGAGAAVWLLRSHRKVRSAELRWHAKNSDRPAPPPAS